LAWERGDATDPNGKKLPQSFHSLVAASVAFGVKKSVFIQNLFRESFVSELVRDNPFASFHNIVNLYTYLFPKAIFQPRCECVCPANPKSQQFQACLALGQSAFGLTIDFGRKLDDQSRLA